MDWGMEKAEVSGTLCVATEPKLSAQNGSTSCTATVRGIAAEGSILVWLPRAGCALLWTASESELLCFSSFAFHFELQTAECLCHFIFVSVCVVTNHTRNHDRIAYMWQKKAIIMAAFIFYLKSTFSALALECEGSSGKCEVWRKQWEVRSVKCGVWSLSLECEARSVKCEVWSVKEAVGSVKCEVWSVKCGVWSFKFGVRRVQCKVWSVKTLLRLSLKKSNGCRGLECEARSVKCEVWSVKEAVGSEKCEVWSAKCEVWSLECEVSSSECEECSEKCGVWRLCFVSRWKNQTVVEGRTRSGQGVFEL